MAAEGGAQVMHGLMSMVDDSLDWQGIWTLPPLHGILEQKI